MPQDNIMKPETVLPSDFTGVFYFTNSWEDKEFIGIWGKKEYHFPPNSTSPMIIPEHSPLEIMHIRKKFAKDWAEQDFFKSQQYEELRSPEGTGANRTMGGIHQARSYTLDDIKDRIQKCIQPLSVKQATITQVQEVPIESKLSRSDDGELNTVALKGKESLKARALEGSGLPS